MRTSRKGCTVALFQRICCALFMRLATIALTALSTNAVEIGSPRRTRRAPADPGCVRDSPAGSDGAHKAAGRDPGQGVYHGQRFTPHTSQHPAAHPSPNQRQGSIDRLARYKPQTYRVIRAARPTAAEPCPAQVIEG